MVKERSIKQLMREFEEIVAWFDSDDIDIEKATEKFDQASKLAEQIKKQIAESKNQIEVVKKKFDL